MPTTSFRDARRIELEGGANAAVLVSLWDAAASAEEGDTSTSFLAAPITLEEAPQLMWIMLPLPFQPLRLAVTVAQAPHHPETA